MNIVDPYTLFPAPQYNIGDLLTHAYDKTCTFKKPDTTVAGVGDPVQTWVERFGTGADLTYTDAGSSPGVPVLRANSEGIEITSSQQWYTHSNLAVTHVRHSFLLIENTGGTYGYYGTGGQVGLRNRDDVAPGTIDISAASTHQVSTPVIVGSGAHIIEIIDNDGGDGTISVKIDGTLVLDSVPGNTFGSYNNNIGKGSGQTAKGIFLAEWVNRARLLTDSEANWVRNQLLDLYNITAPVLATDISLSATNIDEETTGIVGAITSTGDSPAATYSITGGTDQADFSIDGSNNLVLDVAADYETMGANKYLQVEIGATNAAGTFTKLFQIDINDIVESASPATHYQDTTNLQYDSYIYKPAGFNLAAANSYPVLIFFHGSGGVGQGIGDLLTRDAPTPPTEINDDVAAWGQDIIVISPYLPSGDWYVSGVYNMIESVKAAASSLKIDTSKIFVTGLSLGAIYISQLIGDPGTYWSAIAGAFPCSGGASIDAAAAARIVSRSIVLKGWIGEDDPNGFANSMYSNRDTVNAQQAGYYELIEVPSPAAHSPLTWGVPYTDYSSGGIYYLIENA